MNPFLLIQRSPVKRKRRKPQRTDDPKYLKWIRTQPCVACVAFASRLSDSQLEQFVASCKYRRVQQWPTEAAHVGERGLGQLCPAREAIPLCSIVHHREGPESHHKLGKRFWSHHGLDRDTIIQELNERYERECAA
jgi:hypothetical protein